MTPHRSQLLALLLVGLILFVPAPLSGSGSTTPEAAALGPYAVPTEAQMSVVVDALAHLESGGLSIAGAPVVSFHDDLGDCGGNLAYWQAEDGIDRVWVCWTHEDPAVERTVQTQALVHELAHAWVYANTSEAQRIEFMELAGSASWSDASDPWNDRGVEQAADLITWAVLDPAILFVDFDADSCDRWANAFEALTLVPAPATIQAAC